MLFEGRNTNFAKEMQNMKEGEYLRKRARQYQAAHPARQSRMDPLSTDGVCSSAALWA